MPRYDYRCERGHRYEKQEPFGSPAEQPCERCGGNARRVLTPPAIAFKGSGWYKTDSRGPRPSAGESKSRSASTSPSASSNGSSSSNGKASSTEGGKAKPSKSSKPSSRGEKASKTEKAAAD